MTNLYDTGRHTAVGVSLPTTVHFPEHGDISRLGPRLADWEVVQRSAYCDFGADDYEIGKIHARIAAAKRR